MFKGHIAVNFRVDRVLVDFKTHPLPVQIIIPGNVQDGRKQADMPAGLFERGCTRLAAMLVYYEQDNSL